MWEKGREALQPLVRCAGAKITHFEILEHVESKREDGDVAEGKYF